MSVSPLKITASNVSSILDQDLVYLYFGDASDEQWNVARDVAMQHPALMAYRVPEEDAEEVQRLLYRKGIRTQGMVIIRGKGRKMLTCPEAEDEKKVHEAVHKALDEDKENPK
jgi:hypothetical protein